MEIKNLKFSVLAFGLVISVSQLGAQTVAWGTSGSKNPLVFTSNGVADGNIANSTHTLTWELGWFTAGYDVTNTSWDTWAANWHRVSALNAEVDPLDPGGPLVNYPYHRYFSSTEDWGVSVNTYNVHAYTGTVPPGSQAYIFAHNGMEKIGTPQGEVLLYRQDGLTLPTAAQDQITFDIADNPSESTDDNFTVIWGRVDRNMKAVGGVLQGSNSLDMVISVPVFDSNAPALYGTFEAQSATWSAVPEPTGALVVGGLGLLVFMRRRR